MALGMSYLGYDPRVVAEGGRMLWGAVDSANRWVDGRAASLDVPPEAVDAALMAVPAARIIKAPSAVLRGYRAVRASPIVAERVAASGQVSAAVRALHEFRKTSDLSGAARNAAERALAKDVARAKAGKAMAESMSADQAWLARRPAARRMRHVGHAAPFSETVPLLRPGGLEAAARAMKPGAEAMPDALVSSVSGAYKWSTLPVRKPAAALAARLFAPGAARTAAAEVLSAGFMGAGAYLADKGLSAWASTRMDSEVAENTRKADAARASAASAADKALEAETFRLALSDYAGLKTYVKRLRSAIELAHPADADRRTAMRRLGPALAAALSRMDQSDRLRLAYDAERDWSRESGGGANPFDSDAPLERKLVAAMGGNPADVFPEPEEGGDAR